MKYQNLLFGLAAATSLIAYGRVGQYPGLSSSQVQLLNSYSGYYSFRSIRFGADLELVQPREGYCGDTIAAGATGFGSHTGFLVLSNASDMSFDLRGQNWRFEKINGPANTFSAWDGIHAADDGYMSEFLGTDPWFRRDVISFKSTLGADGALTQTYITKHRTLAVFPRGKVQTITSIFTPEEGASKAKLTRFVDGKLAFECEYDKVAPLDNWPTFPDGSPRR